MSKTIITMYDEPSEAVQTVESLVQAGVDRQSVRLMSNMAAGTSFAGEANLLPSLQSLGVTAQDAGHYAEAIRRGGSLIAVTVPDNRVETVQTIVNRFDGGVDRSQPPPTEEPARTEREQYTIPIVEEQLQVGKREVETGNVRIRSRVIETPVQTQVTLREEEIHVERHPVNRALTEADRQGMFQDQTINVTETDEVAVVSKQARVIEEVTIGKQATERTETVRDTVRRTEVDVVETDATTNTPSTEKIKR